MKKKIIITSLLLTLVYLIYQSFVFYITPVTNLQAIYLVPKNAVLIAETQKPIDNWSKISNSTIWKHLQTNTSFNEVTKSINGLDGMLTKKKKLIDLIGNRSLLISVHVYKKKSFGLLYIADLQKITKLELLKNNISSLLSKDYRVSKRTYRQHPITEIYDKKSRETLYISFIENQLIASYVHTLVEASIDQYNEPIIGRDLNFIEINKKVGYDKMFRLYIQYKYIADYLNCFIDKPNSTITSLQENFIFSGFNFDVKRNNIMRLDGYTNTNSNHANYLKALQKSGKGTRTIASIAPERTAFYMSYAFSSFTSFYKNFEEIQKENPKQFEVYQNSIDKIENYLKINIKDNFISWIADEIAILQLQTTYIKQKNELALVLKVTDINKAKDNLNFILKQIKKKTPVKFKETTYKNHTIQFLSIKGFFKVFLGDLFKKIEKPYFTIIDDYVVFSNHPNTLKTIIDNYVAKKTLAKSEDYQSFNTYFDKKSSIFTYINTPVLFANMLDFVDAKTKRQISKNKEFIICFPQIGFQLTPYINLFESKLVIAYEDPKIVLSKEQFKNKKRIGPDVISKIALKKETNILEIEKENLFKVARIYPDNLNAKAYKTMYKNGSTHIKVSLKNGLPNGRYREYFKNGQAKLKGRFKEGKQVKTWRAYDSNGNLLAKKKF